jgi:nucleoside-diphosphate-sugar epimerase
MSRALIGFTGFVGGNLQKQTEFDDFYNSKNIETMAGKSFELIVCAGAPAVKWKANKEPEQDWASLTRLMDSLGQASAQHVILISTVDVYPTPVDVDEDSPIDESSGSAYGRHRLKLEQFVQSRFDTTVIRLPGLFGDGLKKNIIYDFLNNNAVDMICPDSIFQFYHLDNLWRDIEQTRRHGIKLINFATEGVSVREVAREAFGLDFSNPNQTNAAFYDFKTKHARIFDGENGYIYSKEEILTALKAYVIKMRK